MLLNRRNLNEKPRSRWGIWHANKQMRLQKLRQASIKSKSKSYGLIKRSLSKQIRQQQGKQKLTTRTSHHLKQKAIANMMRRIQRLSRPKYMRPKHIFPPKPNYPFSPKIHYKKPPHRDKGRPFENVKLPKWWYNEELEIDFWRWLRFPVSRCALKYKITCNINRMAISKTYPVKPHCSYPPRDYSPPDRVKMKPKQWRDHLKRLNYLADASFKATRQLL